MKPIIYTNKKTKEIKRRREEKGEKKREKQARD